METKSSKCMNIEVWKRNRDEMLILVDSHIGKPLSEPLASWVIWPISTSEWPNSFETKWWQKSVRLRNG